MSDFLMQTLVVKMDLGMIVGEKEAHLAYQCCHRGSEWSWNLSKSWCRQRYKAASFPWPAGLNMLSYWCWKRISHCYYCYHVSFKYFVDAKLWFLTKVYLFSSSRYNCKNDVCLVINTDSPWFSIRHSATVQSYSPTWRRGVMIWLRSPDS